MALHRFHFMDYDPSAESFTLDNLMESIMKKENHTGVLPIESQSQVQPFREMLSTLSYASHHNGVIVSKPSVRSRA